MAVVAAPAERRTKRSSQSEFCLELGILNNMPDAALEQSERQFFTLLSAAAPDLLVRVHFFSLSTIERGSLGWEHLERHAYGSALKMPDRDLDALIVTGAEPRQPDLQRETYWNELTEVFDWIASEGPSTLFSCLAAHAAAFHYDGVERRRLAEKRFGIFEHVVARSDVLTQDLSSPFQIAHSRWNDLLESDLAANGYSILTCSAEAGVELFLKRGRKDLLFCQGHPEYDPTTLAREYRRDVGRYLSGEADAFPILPKNYFSAADIIRLEQFRTRAEFERTQALVGEFPLVAREKDSRWNSPGTAVFRAWLRTIVENKRANRLARPAELTPAFATAAA